MLIDAPFITEDAARTGWGHHWHAARQAGIVDELFSLNYVGSAGTKRTRFFSPLSDDAALLYKAGELRSARSMVSAAKKLARSSLLASIVAPTLERLTASIRPLMVNSFPRFLAEVPFSLDHLLEHHHRLSQIRESNTALPELLEIRRYEVRKVHPNGVDLEGDFGRITFRSKGRLEQLGLAERGLVFSDRIEMHPSRRHRLRPALSIADATESSLARIITVKDPLLQLTDSEFAALLAPDRPHLF